MGCQVRIRGRLARVEQRGPNFDLGCEGLNERSGDKAQPGCPELRNIGRALVGIWDPDLESERLDLVT